MARFFWYFLIYSFLGFLLEVLFARVIRNPKRDRKCFYFLPLCPVYGFGAVAILLLPQSVLERPLLLLVLGGTLATAAEYLTGLFYERALNIQFWDYSHLMWNVGGKVCLLFSGLWGLLSLALVYLVQPLVERLVPLIPPEAVLPALLFLTLDSIFTVIVLRREGTTEALRWYRRPPAPRRRQRDS